MTYLVDLLSWHDVFVMLGSFSLSVLLLGLANLIPAVFGGSGRLSAIQAVHASPVPRVGGVAVFLALAVGTMFHADEALPSLAQFIAAASLLFAAGLLEDLGFSVSPRMRLLAAALASLIVIYMLGFSLDRVDFASVDGLLAISAISIIFTVFMTVGGANAFNLVDGLNGLASFVAVVSALSLSAIAVKAGAHNLAHLCMMLAASVAGFLALNFPFGRIFLGDAGAYSIGFMLAWVGVVLVDVANVVSPWSVLLTLFWPLAETLFTILRRLRSRRSALRPDRMHFHHLVLRALEICVLGRNRRQLANPMATTLMLPFVVAPAVAGIALWNDSGLAFGAVLAFCALYSVTYLSLVKAARRFRRRRSRQATPVCDTAVAGP